MIARLSILGLYDFDNTIFDNLQLPVGILKDDVVNNLLIELSELECLYPNPNLMKSAIGFWSAKKLPQWVKQYATTQFDYKPLNNAYRDEDTTDTDDRNLNNTTTHDLTTADSGTDTDTNYTSGFNETTATMEGKTDSEKGTQSKVTGTTGIADTGTDKHTIHFHTEGSIGVVTPQNMIQQERAVDEFNIIDYIINDFKNRFCILVY